MFISSIFRPKTLIAVGLALVLTTAAYGFAAANTVPDSKAGDGAGTVSGYTVSDVTYVLETTDPSKLDKVTFSLDAAASSVKVRLTASGTWYDATLVSGNDWEVDPAAGALDASTVTTLRVVAID